MLSKRTRRRILVLVPFTALLCAFAAPFVGRFVLHGPVNPQTLAIAVGRETNAADTSLLDKEPCGQVKVGTPLKNGVVGKVAGKLRTRASVKTFGTAGPGTWTCHVGDTAGAGSTTYRVVVKPGTSCWTADVIVDDSETPRHDLTGCVHRWQWTILGGIRPAHPPLDAVRALPDLLRG
jgi:hypothetical protein